MIKHRHISYAVIACIGATCLEILGLAMIFAGAHYISESPYPWDSKYILSAISVGSIPILLGFLLMVCGVTIAYDAFLNPRGVHRD
jgi:hypothetical protein